MTRLLGAQSAPAATIEPTVADARYHLVGVISPFPAQGSHEGLALIAVDDRAPEPFRVGAVVAGSDVLQAVDARSVRLGPRDSAAAVILSLASPHSAMAGGPLDNAPARSIAIADSGALPTAQQLFQRRQQLQFEEEMAQNQRAAP